MELRIRPTLFIATLVLAFALPLLGEESDAGEGETAPRAGKAGYGEKPTLGGPNGVARELQDADRVEEYRFDLLHRSLKPYFDWKAGLNENYGLTLGLHTNLLYQYADGTIGDRDNAGGGIYRLQGSWNAVGRGTGHSGSLGFRLEYRSKIGPLGPSSLSGDLGVGPVNTAFAYSDEFGPDLAVINWTQFFADSRVGVVLGRLDFAAYLDPYPFQTLARGFLNRAFIVNPSTAVTGVGALGIGIKGFVGKNIWLGGFAYDANAASGDFDFDTFDSGELFKHFEVGWTPSYEKRKTDKVLLTYWQKDERVAAGALAGEGWLVTANFLLGDRYSPFLRWGSSDGGGGAPAEEALSVGLGILIGKDELALGIGWAEPSELTFGQGLRDEKVFEASYRFQMSPNTTLMPDVQLVLDPTKNPDEDQVWILGLRARWEI